MNRFGWRPLREGGVCRPGVQGSKIFALSSERNITINIISLFARAPDREDRSDRKEFYVLKFYVRFLLPSRGG